MSSSQTESIWKGIGAEAPVPFASTSVLLPKNSGLAAQSASALASRKLADVVRSDIRGEDIPNLANALARTGRRVLAYTGEDILEDWLAAGNVLDPRIVRGSIPWNDPKAMYGKPALCLIGTTNRPLSACASARIALCTRYQHLVTRLLKNVETRIELVPVLGTPEAMLSHGLADYIIDIVLTGRTLRAEGFVIQEVLFTSDLAVLETRQ